MVFLEKEVGTGMEVVKDDVKVVGVDDAGRVVEHDAVEGGGGVVDVDEEMAAPARTAEECRKPGEVEEGFHTHPSRGQRHHHHRSIQLRWQRWKGEQSRVPPPPKWTETRQLTASSWPSSSSSSSYSSQRQLEHYHKAGGRNPLLC